MVTVTAVTITTLLCTVLFCHNTVNGAVTKEDTKKMFTQLGQIIKDAVEYDVNKIKDILKLVQEKIWLTPEDVDKTVDQIIEVEKAIAKEIKKHLFEDDYDSENRMATERDPNEPTSTNEPTEYNATDF